MESVLSYYRDHPGYLNHSPLFPDPVICLRDMAIQGSHELNGRFPWNGMRNWLQETVDVISFTVDFDHWVLIWPLVIALLLTMARVTANFVILKRIPVWLKFTKENTIKFPESVFKFTVYSITWSWAIYILVHGEENYFFNLKSHWINWHPGEHVDAPLYWLYMFQMGFYLHSAYATLYIETIRMDFGVMMAHHVVTLSLILFSFVVRFHKIGLLVLFIQDIGDITLELAKIFVYTKTRDGKDYYWPEMLANAAFVCFALQHIIFRLYWYPVKVVYSTMFVDVQIYPYGPYYLFFNMLLIMLYFMQVYWFKFIVDLAIKVFFKGEQTTDNREYDAEAKAKRLREEKAAARKEQNGEMEGGSNVRKRHSKTNMTEEVKEKGRKKAPTSIKQGGKKGQ